MNALRSKLNWFIIPALVFGMGATGVSNCLLFGGGCGSRNSASHKAPTCCCCKGHCHGQCGMACCQKPAPSQDQLPSQPKSHDDSGPTLGLVMAVPAGVDFASAGATHGGNFSEFAGTTAGPSLLALNVRFNV
jgi:hypothetical protein